MNRYLSGNGDNPLNSIAEHALLRLAARGMIAVGGPIIIGLGVLLWNSFIGLKDKADMQALSVIEIHGEMAVLATRVEGLNDVLQQATDSRYRATDANRDLGLRDQRLDRLESRIRDLERRSPM